MIKYCLMGAHQHRTPLSYNAFRRYFPAGLVPVERAENPDVLVFGYVQDFFESFEQIQEARAHNPDVKLVVISEEPFWDTLWSGDYTQRYASRAVNGEMIPYFAINHVNSDVFAYHNLPYLVTTADSFFARYAMMFARNSTRTERDFRRVWEGAAVQQAFYAEKRLADKFAYSHPENDVQGLCQFRSRLAALMLDAEPASTKVVGKGWHSGGPRQKLPDWHLDKLAALDGKSRIISALENTQQPLYTTEKLFDAFACQGIPLYWASTSHRIHEWIPEGAYINLQGLTAEEAVQAIQGFTPDQAFLDQYRAAQSELARRFGNADILEAERKRLAEAAFRALSEVMESE